MMKTILQTLVAMFFCLNLQAQWDKVETNIDITNGTDLFFVDGAVGYLVEKEEQLYKTVDSGKTWQQITLPNNTRRVEILRFTDALNGYIHVGLPPSGGFNHIFRTNNGGQKWIKVLKAGMNGKGDHMASAAVISGSVVFANTNDSLWRTMDSGRTWQAIGPAFGRQVMMLNQREGFTIDNNQLLKTTNSGQNAEVIFTAPRGYDIYSASFQNMNEGIVVYGRTLWNGVTTIIEKTTNAGATWNRSLLIEDDVRLVTFANDDVGFLSTSGNDMFYTENGGGSWLPYTEFDTTIYSMHFINPRHGFAAGVGLYVTKNGGGKVVGVDAAKAEKGFSVFPNPATQTINFKTASFQEAHSGQITIYSADGKQMLQQSFHQSSIGSIDVAAWQRCIYIAILENDGGQKTTKFLLH